MNDNDIVIPLKFYLEGLKSQILHHVDDIETLRAFREEMKAVQGVLKKMEQMDFNCDFLKRKSKASHPRPCELKRKKTA